MDTEQSAPEVNPPGLASHITLSLEPNDARNLAVLCGQLDAHLRQIEKRLDITIHNRSNHFELRGAHERCQLAASLLSSLYTDVENGAQLLFLEAEDPEKDIQIYINSPGGSVTAGLAIYDTMQQVAPDVVTICYGLAASMGAFLLSGGTKGKRLALPNARIMIHQPMGGAQGQAVDIEIQAQEILYLKETLNGLMAEHTGQPLEKIAEDTDRDHFLSPAEAVEYGLIDRVVDSPADGGIVTEG